MAFTVDYATDRGKVRLVITDVDSTNPLFDDDQVDAFLGIEADNVLRAAALALETIASNESLVQKMTRLVDLQTNGPAVAKDLRDHAKNLRERADALETDDAFDWAEWVTGPFSERERIVAQYERELV